MKTTMAKPYKLIYEFRTAEKKSFLEKVVEFLKGE